MSSKAVTSTTPTLTPAMVRQGKGLAADTDAVVAFVSEAKRTADKATGAAMWFGGLGAYRTVDMTKDLTAKDYAARTGFAESYVSRLRRIGNFAVNHGIARGSEAFTFLAQYGSRAEVGVALQRPDPKSALLALVEASKKAKVETREARPGIDPARGDTAPDGTDREDGTAVQGETDWSTRTLSQILTALDSAVQTLSLDEWYAAETRIAAIVTRENNRHTAALKVTGEVVAV